MRVSCTDRRDASGCLERLQSDKNGNGYKNGENDNAKSGGIAEVVAAVHEVSVEITPGTTALLFQLIECAPERFLRPAFRPSMKTLRRSLQRVPKENGYQLRHLALAVSSRWSAVAKKGVVALRSPTPPLLHWKSGVLFDQPRLAGRDVELRCCFAPLLWCPHRSRSRWPALLHE